MRERSSDGYQLKMKFALVSYVLPPSYTGQAVMLYRLLKGLHADNYCLISLEGAVNQGNYSDRLPGEYYLLPQEFQLTRGYRFGLATLRFYLNLVLGLLISLPLRAQRIARIVRRERCEAVVGCGGGEDVLYLPASYLASRLAGVPFYAYLFDDYATQWAVPIVRRVARCLEPHILKGAAGIVAHSEFLHDEIQKRYGIESVVIHNPCDLSPYKAVSDAALKDQHDEVRIVYTGAVSEAQKDAIKNLLQVIEQLDRPGVKLHVYSAQPPDVWAALGIGGPVVHHEHQPVNAIPGIQQQADLLFLPLAFNSPYQEHIKTAAPGKMGEYLASRRPVLVHAPADSFVAWYFRRHECGYVVDEPKLAKLADALESLLSDTDLVRRLVANAWARACSDFSIEAAQEKFMKLLKSGGSAA